MRFMPGSLRPIHDLAPTLLDRGLRPPVSGERRCLQVPVELSRGVTRVNPEITCDGGRNSLACIGYRVFNPRTGAFPAQEGVGEGCGGSAVPVTAFSQVRAMQRPDI